MVDPQPQSQSQPLNLDEGQFFQKYSPNQTEGEFFSRYDPDQNKSFAGEAWDYMFGHANTNTKKELNAFGQGFKQGWGTEPLGLSEDTEKKLGILNGMKDFTEGRGNVIKAANEAWMRSAAWFGDAAWRGVTGAATGLTHFTYQTLADVAPEKLARDVAGMEEYYFQTGMPEAHIPVEVPNQKIITTQRARAESVIGESEGAYFGTKEPTEQQTQERTEAGQHLAELVPEVAAPPADIHTVARQLAPEVFDQYDQHLGYRNYYRNQIAELQDQVPDNPRIKELQDQIKKLEIYEKKGSLTDKQSDRLDSYRDELESTPKKLDTPEIGELRQKLLEADYKMRDLAPDVARAYRMAQEHLGTETVPGSEAPEASQEAPQTPEATPVAGEAGKAVEPSKGPSESPKGPQGEGTIQAQTYNALIKAGRTPEEARATAELIASHYETRAARFRGKLGSGLDLFNRDFPEIKSGEFKSKGKTYEQRDLSETERKFVQLGQLQRDKPEHAMVKAQHAMGGGVLSPVIEHIGDLTHRMTEMLGWLSPRVTSSTGYEFVKPKIERGIRYLESGYGFDRELKENIQNNAKGRNQSVEEFTQKLDEALSKYAEEHAKLPVYNEAQRLARDAAVKLGQKNWNGALSDLKELNEHLGSEEDWHKFASEGLDKEYRQSKKGSLTVTPHGQKNILRLFKDADASTFLHETGHQWLEELMADAHHELASDSVKSDWNSIKKWLGVRENQNNLTRKQHEKFARGFERYLMEGRAPTKELAGIFQQFKAWLTKIYESVLNLKSPINNDIRDVFDRLIAQNPEKTTITGEYEPKEITQPPEVTAPKATATDETPDQVDEKGNRTFISPENIVKPAKGEFVDKAGNINLDLITSKEDLKDVLREVIEKNDNLYPARRGVVSDSDNLKLAESLAVRPNKVEDIKENIRRLSGADTDIPLSASVKALQIVMAQATKAVSDAAAEGDAVKFAQSRARLLDLAETFSGVTAEWGRTGRMLQVGAVKDSVQLADFLQANTGKTYYQLMDEIKRIKKLDTTQKIMGFVKDSERTGLGKMLQEIFINWIISGPITHTGYLVGQELLTATRIAENTIQAGISKIHELIDKPEEGEFDELTYLAEMKQEMYALGSGHVDGIKSAWKAFLSGQTELLPGEERASTVFTQQKAIPDLKVGPVPVPVGSVVRIPSERMIAPIHSFNRTVAYTVARNQLIYKYAKNEGLEGDDLSRRIAELKTNTPVAITVEARAQASELALMGKPGEFTRKAIAFLHHEINIPILGRFAPGAFITPFISIGSNINRLAVLERTPIGVFAKTVRDDLMGENGRLAQDTAAAKMLAGTAIYAGVAYLTTGGLFNSAGPTDYKAAAVHKMTHGLPHSVRVGEMSYAFDRLGVLGTMLSLASDIGQYYSDATNDDPEIHDKAGTEFLSAVWEHLTSEGMLSGISDVVQAAHEPDRYGSSWAANYLSTFARPVGSAQIAQRIDPYQRDVHGETFSEKLHNAITAKTPYESETLMPRVDLFGQPLPNKGFEGVYTQQLSNDPVWTALESSSYFPAPVKRDINGVKLTNEQYHEYASQAGYLAHMMLSQEVSQPWFVQADEHTRHELIKSAFEKSRQIASSVVKGNHPEIVVKAINQKYQLAQGE